MNAEERFKTNLLEMIESLKEDFQNSKTKSSLDLLQTMLGLADAKLLIEEFDKIITKEREDGTLLEIHERLGHNFRVINILLQEIPMISKLDLHTFQFENLSEENQDLYLEYLNSFFRIRKSYLGQK